MKPFFCLILTILTFHSICARTITDMAGRDVTIPDKIERLLPYDVKTSLLIYPIAQHRMVARSKMQGRKSFKYMDPNYNQLPEYDIRNIEEVLMHSPDLIITATGIGRSNTDKYLQIGRRIGVPVVLIDLSIDKLADTYLFLGELLGDSEKGSICSLFLDSTLRRVSSWCVEHPNNDGAYFTLGNQGLLTDIKGSVHTEVFDYLNVPNVVTSSIVTGGHSQVNLEQIIKWNPEYIFVADYKGNNEGYKHIVSHALWQSISALSQHQVYQIPYYPVGWFDHPPSINRILGIIWMSQVYYGYPEDMAAQHIRRFFDLFFNYPLSLQEYESIV